MATRPFFAFHFHKHAKTPLYIQLFEQLQTAILRGAFLEGDQLLSLREMKAISGCSLETVKRLTGAQSFRLSDEPEGLRRRPAVRFPLSPLDKRESKYCLHWLGAGIYYTYRGSRDTNGE